MAEICSNDVLVAHCFDCLLSHFSNGTMPALPEPYNSSGIECPMFVTLHKNTKRGQELRGCIGCLSPIPLTSINDYVYKSGFEDTRFPPLLEEEVPTLDISFSVLTQFERTDNHLDWELETHGIRISFMVGRQRYSGTYLPGVASEQRWTKAETLISLVRKAGYKGKDVNEDFFKSIEVVRYQSSKHNMSYDVYRSYKDGQRMGY